MEWGFRFYLDVITQDMVLFGIIDILTMFSTRRGSQRQVTEMGEYIFKVSLSL